MPDCGITCDRLRIDGGPPSAFTSSGSTVKAVILFVSSSATWSRPSLSNATPVGRAISPIPVPKAPNSPSFGSSSKAVSCTLVWSGIGRHTMAIIPSERTAISVDELKPPWVAPPIVFR